MRNLILYAVIVSAFAYSSGPEIVEGMLQFKSQIIITGIDNNRPTVMTDQKWFNKLATNWGINILRRTFPNRDGDYALYYNMEFDSQYSVQSVIVSFQNTPEINSSWDVNVGHSWIEDTYYDEQWALNTIDAYNAWQYQSGNDDVIIAVIDPTGFWFGHEPSGNTLHEDLQGNFWNENGKYGLNIAHPSELPYAENWRHGTIVCGVFGATT